MQKGRLCVLLQSPRLHRPLWSSFLPIGYVPLLSKSTLAVQEVDDKECHEVPCRNSNLPAKPVIFLKNKGQLIDFKNAPSGAYVHIKEKYGLNISREALESQVLEAENKDSVKERKTHIVGAIQASELEWREQARGLQALPSYYLQLGKSRLSALVVASAMAGYVVAPVPFDLTPFLLCSLGTGLTSFAANSVNQFLEVPFDSQMSRTKNRVLVRGVLSPVHAVGFAAASALGGIGILYYGVNGTCAALGLANLFLYTSVYTPMKRLSIANTWVGSIVGGIPPVMGWVAATGSIDAGALVLSAFLFAWQFPHFNALSWNLRQDYSRAGYRMMCASHPRLCCRTTLRYSVVLLGLSVAAPVMDVTTWTFTVDSLPFNMYMLYLSWKFYHDADSSSSRRLFRFSLIYLPVVMMLMLISKKPAKENAVSS